MKVLIISSEYPTVQNESDGSFVYEQVKMLQENGHQVAVIKPNLNGSFKDTLKGKLLKQKTYTFDKIEVYEVTANVLMPKSKFYYYKLLQKRVNDTINRNNLKFDIIHSHSFLSAGVIAPYISIKYNKDLIHTEHSSGIIFNPNQYDKIDKHYFSLLSEQAKKIIFVSTFSMNQSLCFFNNRIEKSIVISNLVDDSFFVKNPINLNFNAIAIGDFSPRKNQLFLLEVWSHIVCVKKEAVLTLAGNGFEDSSFMKKVNDLNLKKNITVVPSLSRKGVADHICEKKVLLSAAIVETFGLTIAEALAMGVPVVVTDSGGPRDIVENGDGFIVPQDDINLYVQSILKIFEGNHDSPAVISERCRRKFGINTIYKNLIQVYLESK